MSDVSLLSSYYCWSCLPLYFCIIDQIVLTSLPPQMLCSSVSRMTELLFMFQSRLLDSDLQLLQTELMEASLTDTSGLSFFEHFHISPIKVKKRTASSVNLKNVHSAAFFSSISVCHCFYKLCFRSISVCLCFYVLCFSSISVCLSAPAVMTRLRRLQLFSLWTCC